MTVSLASLVVRMTKDQILSAALGIASAIGLAVDTWQPGDPTRSLYLLEAEILDPLEETVVNFINAGFRDTAVGDWLKFGVAKQVYNIDVPDATYATTSVTLTNGLGGVFDVAPGDLTFKSSLSGKTYHNTSGGHIASGPATTLAVDVIADEPGADSSAGAGEIDAMVTNLLGVTCSNPTAAVGLDAQSDDVTRQQCLDKLGSLSPNGPKEAYAYVARNQTLTGPTGVTRVRVYADSTTGHVTVYLAGPSGPVSGADVTAVTNAIATWATPLCITPTISSASGVSIPVTYTIWVYKSANKTTADVQADVLSALQDLFAARPIGGDIIPPATTGAFYAELIQSTVRSVYKPEVAGVTDPVFRATVSAPTADTALGNGAVATLGLVTATVIFVDDP